MPYKIVRKNSLCKECPLQHEAIHKCYGISDIQNPKIAFIGEAPGRKEDEMGIPFVGSSGAMLNGTVAEIGKKFYQAHKTNVILCRPPKNNIESFEAQEAITCCRAGFIEELNVLKKKGTKVLMAVGGTALTALNIEGTISKNRGSVYMLKLSEKDIKPVTEGPFDFVCIPTFHPSFLFRGQLKHEVSFINDIEKAYSLVDTPYVPPKENFKMFPTISYIEKEVDKIIKNKTLIGVDIESTGLVPGKARILMVGIATSGEDAFTIPFSKQGGSDYWKTPQERMRAHTALQKLMDKAPTVFQNCLFDMRHLEHFGCPVNNLKHDTMILHHCVSPELPHNLGYIVSVYGKTPYWKDEVLAAPDRMINMDDEKVRTYNLRDSVVLLQILPELIKEAKEDGTYWIYENISMPLVKPVMALMRNGIMLDKKKLETWKREIKSKIESFSKDLVKYGSLPENFNLSSGDHMRCLLYGEMPARIERLEKELQKYSDNPKLRKDTKKYKEIVNGLELFKSIKPFPRLRHTIKKTETGGLSVDDEAILNLQVACNNRLKELRNLKRKKAEHETEKTSLDNLVKFIAAYREYTTYEKLNSTYTNFPVDQDNRVRFPYRITGTNTGRFASGDKKSGEAGNAQNIPDPAKHIFVAPTGKILLYGDYSNLELRVTAHVTGDKPLINIFNSGLKVHKENQKVMFGLPEDHELYKEAYRACKTYIFGRGYGGGLRGIYTRLVKAVPELNLTFEKFCEVDAAYKNAHPTIIKWEEKTRETVRETRCLTNAFGRKRYFLGSGAEIEREGLNFPIQCLGFGTKILNKNLEWVNVEDAQIGDKLVAFDETLLKNAGAPHRKWRIATITHCQHDIEYVYEILFDDTTKVYATGEHKWLCYPYNAKRDGCAWVRTDELVENKTTIPKVFDVWETDKSKSAGYLAGAFDADGTLYQTGTHTAVQFCQVENVVLKKVEEFLKEKRFDYHITKCTAEGKRKFNYVWNSLYIKGGIPEQLRFLGQIRPYRLLERFDLLNMSRRFVNSGRKARKVIKVTALHSKRPIVKIATDTKTFFADGMPTHNSTAADIVNFSLIRVQKAIDSGLLKSKMVLTVHDSIMFETPDKLLKKEAKIIKALMEEPVKINNKKVIFPVEFEIGKDWGSMKEYKI